jgi:hypothetical protein
MGTKERRQADTLRTVLGQDDGRSPADQQLERIKVTLDKTPPTKPGNLGDYEKGTARG